MVLAANAPDPLAGIHSEDNDGVIPPVLLEYLRHKAKWGIDVRLNAEVPTVRAKPLPSAVEYQQEALEQAWKDAKEGRVIMCRADNPSLL